MLGKEMLLVSKKSGPLTENNLIVQSSQGNGFCYYDDSAGKTGTINIGGYVDPPGDQVYSVTFPVNINWNRKWAPRVKAISNALLKITETAGAPPGYGDVIVTPIDPSKPAIIDVYNGY